MTTVHHLPIEPAAQVRLLLRAERRLDELLAAFTRQLDALVATGRFAPLVTARTDLDRRIAALASRPLGSEDGVRARTDLLAVCRDIIARATTLAAEVRAGLEAEAAAAERASRSPSDRPRHRGRVATVASPRPR